MQLIANLECSDMAMDQYVQGNVNPRTSHFDVHKGYRLLTHSHTMLPKVADKLSRQVKWLHFPDVS